jgi:hypothetical protein
VVARHCALWSIWCYCGARYIYMTFIKKVNDQVCPLDGTDAKCSGNKKIKIKRWSDFREGEVL